MKLEYYAFPVPPVCTARWTEADWLRWAETNGKRLRCCCRAFLSGDFMHGISHGARKCERIEAAP